MREQSSPKVAFLNLCRQRTMGLLETLDTGSLNHGWIARDLVRDAHTGDRSRTAHDERTFSLLVSGFRTLRGRQEEFFSG